MLCHSARQTHLCRATCKQPAARGPGSLRPAQRRSSSLAGRGEEQRPQPAPGRRGTPQLRGSASRDLLVPAAERNRARPRRLRPCGGGRGGIRPHGSPPPSWQGAAPGPALTPTGVGNQPEREGELAGPRPRRIRPPSRSCAPPPSGARGRPRLEDFPARFPSEGFCRLVVRRGEAPSLRHPASPCGGRELGGGKPGREDLSGSPKNLSAGCEEGRVWHLAGEAALVFSGGDASGLRAARL